MNKQQTAVDWVFSQLPYEIKSTRHGFDFYRMAKEMEREQIIQSNIAGMEFIPVDPSMYRKDAEQYYNQTFEP